MTYLKFINFSGSNRRLSIYGYCSCCDQDIKREYVLENEEEISIDIDDLVEVAIK
jgi:hypothetical protein